MDAETEMDGVADLIASIEVHRQEIQRATGLDPARNYALRRLRLALLREQEKSRLHGSSPARLAIADAIAAEIRRVETLASIPSQRPRRSWRDMQRQSPESRGSGTTGRRTRR
jgi:hypothetical protein